MASTHSGIPDTNRTSEPMRPFLQNRAGRTAGAIALPATSPQPTRCRLAAPRDNPNSPPRLRFWPWSPHHRPSRGSTAQASRPPGRGPARPPLQSTDRAVLPPLGEALHLLPSRPPPRRDGRARDQRLPDPSGGQGEGQRLDTESGPEGACCFCIATSWAEKSATSAR